ncbi:MAG: beta-lactamase family protein [Acetatifactor sp.]|nr:beta-lactamase family protein [Acetatifactor sp.]
MEKIIRILSFVAFAFFVTLFMGCANADEVKNYTIVYSDNDALEYVNHGRNTDEKTIYELGSNGKTVAAYVALAMVDEGVLSLDEKIAPYLDADLVTNDERIKEITLRQLLCHTAGFSPSYELGVDKKIYSDPGTEFRYSGVGYIYLQSVIENAGKLPVDQAAAKYVFEPLGMKNSTFENAKTITPYMNLGNVVLYALAVFAGAFLILSVLALIIGRITKFKVFTFKRAFPVCFLLAGMINTVVLLFVLSNLSKVYFGFLACFVIMGSLLFLTRKKASLFYSVAPLFLLLVILLGSLIPVTIPVTNDLVQGKANVAYSFKSNGEDVAIFCKALMSKMKEENGVFREMFLPNVKIDDRNSWGLGIAMEYAGESRPTYWHSGINPGFQSLYVLYPEENKFVAVLTNNDRGLDFAKDIARSFLDVTCDWNIKR